MSVRLETSVKRFIGLSTDVKPVVGETFAGTAVAANDLPAGSTFMETDVFLADGTCRIARWNGLTWTYPSVSESVSEAVQSLVETMEAMRLELAAIRLGMIEAGTCKFVNQKDAAELAAA